MDTCHAKKRGTSSWSGHTNSSGWLAISPDYLGYKCSVLYVVVSEHRFSFKKYCFVLLSIYDCSNDILILYNGTFEDMKTTKKVKCICFLHSR